jgi:hypothetical protein
VDNVEPRPVEISQKEESDKDKFYENSDFYKAAKKIFDNVKKSIKKKNEDDDSTINHYNSHEFIEQIIKRFICVAPLFVNVKNDDIDVGYAFTNNNVEGYFGVLKQQLRSKTLQLGVLPLRYGRFCHYIYKFNSRIGVEYELDLPNQGNATGKSTQNTPRQNKMSKISSSQEDPGASTSKNLGQNDDMDYYRLSQQENLAESWDKPTSSERVQRKKGSNLGPKALIPLGKFLNMCISK